MAVPHPIEVVVGEDGTVVIPAEKLDRAGAHPGDRLRIQVVPRRRRKSMLGALEGLPRTERGFTQEDLSEIRREMGKGIGEDITA